MFFFYIPIKGYQILLMQIKISYKQYHHYAQHNKKIQKNTAILNQHINRHETGINIKTNGPRQNIANISR